MLIFDYAIDWRLSERAYLQNGRAARGWEEQKWRKPRISEKARPNKVELEMDLPALTDNPEGISLGEKETSYINNYTRGRIIEALKDFCQEWKSAEEIAILLHRSTGYVRKKVLPLYKDRFEREYRNNPTHPQQRYKWIT